MPAIYLKHRGLSLAELLSVAAILAVLAALIVPRVIDNPNAVNRAACHVNCAEVERQAAIWRRNMGGFPAADLGDAAADLAYFPAGIPVCPIDGTTYTIDTSSGFVVGHNH
jgi:general secretion pathway protein G